MRYLYNEDLSATDIAISDKIISHTDKVLQMNISELAIFCGVSVSKISKYSKKLGFNGFKDFIFQLKIDYNNSRDKGGAFDYQKDKINLFFEDYNPEIVENIQNIIMNSNKIYLFGRGPSHNVCEYYTPRLRVATGKNFISDYDEYLFDLDYFNQNENDKKTAIILTVSGKSKKVHEMLKICNDRNITTICISSYYNDKLAKNSTEYLSLINRKEVFDKSVIRGRTLFFIFLEILTQDFLDKKDVKSPY